MKAEYFSKLEQISSSQPSLADCICKDNLVLTKIPLLIHLNIKTIITVI